jgi:hypothetical protein
LNLRPLQAQVDLLATATVEDQEEVEVEEKLDQELQSLP